MKRRFVQDPVTLELIEVSADFVPDPRNGDSTLWNDRTYQDGGDPRFSSRSQHREYMARNGLTTVDDYMGPNGEFARAEKRREEFRSGKQRDPARREAIGRALHKHLGS